MAKPRQFYPVLVLLLVLEAVVVWYVGHRYVVRWYRLVELTEIGDLEGVQYVCRWDPVQASQPGALACIRWDGEPRRTRGRNADLETEQCTPLVAAARRGHGAIVAALLAAGANALSYDGDGESVVCLAALAGSAEAVRALLAAGAPAEVTATRNPEQTALYAAATAGYAEVVKVLAAGGANVEVADRDGLTALGAAARAGHAETVKALVEARANVQAQDHGGWTALHHAAAVDATAAVRALLAAGAEVGFVTNHGQTALHHAALLGQVETVRALLAAGARVMARDQQGWTPLHRASWAGHPEVVGVLLAAGADREARDQAGRTPLLAAAANGHPAAVLALVDAGADLRARDADGWTALHHAAYGGHLTTIRALLAAGAAPDVRTPDGRTPADVARTNEPRLLLALAGRQVGGRPWVRVPARLWSAVASPARPRFGFRRSRDLDTHRSGHDHGAPGRLRPAAALLGPEPPEGRQDASQGCQPLERSANRAAALKGRRKPELLRGCRKLGFPSPFQGYHPDRQPVPGVRHPWLVSTAPLGQGDLGPATPKRRTLRNPRSRLLSAQPLTPPAAGRNAQSYNDTPGTTSPSCSVL